MARGMHKGVKTTLWEKDFQGSNKEAIQDPTGRSSLERRQAVFSTAGYPQGAVHMPGSNKK